MKYFYCIILFSISCFSFAQKHDQKGYEKGLIFIQKGQYEAAIQQFEKLVAADSSFVKAVFGLAELYNENKDIKKAVPLYKRLTEMDSFYHPRQVLVPAKYYISISEYTKAENILKYIKQFKKINYQSVYEAELLTTQCEFAKRAFLNPVPFDPINLGDSINTPNIEALPSLTADDSTLLFLRNTQNQEDLYIAKKGINGEWEQAKLLPGFINTPYDNEGAQTISPDGAAIYFTSCGKKDSYGSCDLYVSNLKKGIWQKPINLGENINSKAWDSQPSISSDGRAIYFTSNREGGYGNADLYVSYLNEKGEWGLPQNLGNLINTRGSESAPYIHPDGKTLYFSSDGHPGMGQKDLFVSRFENGAWQTPFNLGYPINTSKNETSLFVTLDGKQGFYASNGLDTRGKDDIFNFELYTKIRPGIMVYLKGSVLDRNTLKHIKANIDIIDLATGNSVYKTLFDPENPQYIACLSLGKSYGMNVTAPNYLFYSENFALTDSTTTSKVYNILMEPFLEGKEIILKNIFFDTDSFNLKPISKPELARLAEFLSLNPDHYIEIQGFTDNQGNKDYNQKLSEKRAKAVYEALLGLNIPKIQLTFKGYGDANPIAKNDIEANRALNRRTQYKIGKLKQFKNP